MTEKEIRDVIKAVCADIDQRVRQTLSQGVRKVVLPATLGAGLALSAGACNDDDRSAPSGDAQAVVEAGVDGGPQPAYMAPADAGPQPPYMAPDAMISDAAIYAAPDASVDAPPQPPYMAPDAGMLYAAPSDASLDAPPLPPYMAPDATLPQPDYMAPDPDGGPNALYAAVGPDGGNADSA